MRRTKIVATIGPASQDEEKITQLIQAGVNVFRINFSHGDHKTHDQVIRSIRSVSQLSGSPVTILQDLQGPKIRIGEIYTGETELEPGQQFTLTTRSVPGDNREISVDFPELPNYVKADDKILLDDGNLELLVISSENTDVMTQVILGGTLKPHKGINLPGIELDIQGFTEKDAKDLAFGMDHGVDLVAVSFVRSSKDVERVREAIINSSRARFETPIIAKLERPEALENLEAIVKTADGVMVARGDLGVEMSPEFVPIAQKQIIDSANQNAKIVITATQMLESMIYNPRPTRAETTDVANAIFDGSDAVMLSGETAVGKYPVQSVKMMNAIIAQAEAHIGEWGQCFNTPSTKPIKDDAYYMTLAARELAHDRNVAGIAVFTKSGRSALLMSKARPDVPIFAFTPELTTYQQLGIMWGVIPHFVPHADTIEDMTKVVEATMIASTPIKPGQQVVLICGFPIASGCPANLALLHTVS
ncbi:MAG: pyruvate kinase [Chloroflexi bacterium]|nr:pyruvate kinase [Chloroflexota bacterium]